MARPLEGFQVVNLRAWVASLPGVSPTGKRPEGGSWHQRSHARGTPQLDRRHVLSVIADGGLLLQQLSGTPQIRPSPLGEGTRRRNP